MRREHTISPTISPKKSTSSLRVLRQKKVGLDSLRIFRAGWTCWAALSIGILLSALSVGCDDDAFTRGANAKLVVEPESVTFNPVSVGEHDSRLLVISNAGTGTLLLPANPDHYVLVPSNAPFAFTQYATIDGETVSEIPPNGEAALRIDYIPTTDIPASATLTLISTNGGEVAISINTALPVARLQVNPNPVIFGGVSEGESAEIPVTISNVGTAELSIMELRLSQLQTVDFEIIDPLITPLSLRPEEERSFTVRYTPSGNPDEPDLGELIFTTNNAGSANGLTTVEIIGGESRPIIEVEPIRVDFGGLDAGQRESRSVLVSNIGEDPLIIDHFELGFGTTAEFSATSDDMPLTLDPGAPPTLITVDYAPVDSGTDTGYLFIYSNDTRNPSVAVTLLGSLAGPEMVVQPQVLEFGGVALTISKTLSFDIINQGNRALEITSLDPIDFPADGALTMLVDGAELVFPIMIPEGEKERVDVTFLPTIELPPGQASILVTGNDPENVDEDVLISFEGLANGVCEVELVPIELNFGLVIGGGTSQLPIEVRNVGAAPCLIQNINVQTSTLIFGQNPFELGSPQGSFVIDPSSSELVYFDYSPFRGSDSDAFVGQATFLVTDILNGGTVACESPDPGGSILADILSGNLGSDSCFFSFISGFNLETPECWACIRGKTGDPELAAVPSLVDFGKTTLDCSSPKLEVKIYNKGNAPTELQGVTLDPACADGFTITRIPPTPTPLPPGSFEVVELYYTPGTPPTTQSCRLIVDGTTESLTIPITGEGTTETKVVDVFEQLSGRAVDVLFVVDNSGSMSDNQSALASNFSSFISQAQTWNIDYQIGVVTTDSGDGGRLQSRSGHPRIITPLTPNFQQAFESNVQVGDSGSATEKGLSAAENALRDPNITESVPGTCPGSCADPYTCDTITGLCGGFNATFLREDATLDIVFVSDEDDFSPAALSYYVDFFKNIKGYRNDGLFHAHAIIGDSGSSSCNISSRYADVTNQTGGVVGCLGGNFSNTLNAIGASAFGLRVEFFLSRYPAPDGSGAGIPPTLQVFVDGTEKAPGSEFTYDSDTNSIIFSAGNVPEENSSIEVRYDAACFCEGEVCP